MTRAELREQWVQRRRALLECGQTQAVFMADKFLADLDQVDAPDPEDVLTIPQASAVSGYSPGHLRRLVRLGKLDNLGHRNSPRVRRSQLPAKPRRLTENPLDRILISKAEVARSIVHLTRNNDG